MKQAVEYAYGLCYKLQMMWIACEEPEFAYGDNLSVLSNTTVTVSAVKKKMSSVSYHFIREGCALDKWRIVCVNTHLNCVDLPIKYLPVWLKGLGFITKFL